MRNLYSRLGIDPSATEQEIRVAIAKCKNSAIRTDATDVLLNVSRRRSYDQVLRTLSDIGVLRAHLGLNHGKNWGNESDDFNVNTTHEISLYNELIAKVKRLNKKPKFNAFINSVKDYTTVIFRLAAFFGSIAGFIWIILILVDSPQSTSTPRSSYSQPTFNEPALQLPKSGVIRRYTAQAGVAPLEIKTSQGTNYLVKLEDVSSGRNILDVFIRGGSTIEIKVPLGTYHLKYAIGQTWYGYEHYFGPSTRYTKADSNFRFYDDGRSLSGYTVTLYQVRDGNLSTSRLSPGQF